MPEPDIRYVAFIFEGLVTLALAAVHLGLWRQRREEFHAVWAAAWMLYAVRLAAISAYIADRREVWLFLHQSIIGISALLFLWAALRFATRVRWRRRYLWAGVGAVAWAAIAVFGIRSPAVAGTSSAVLFSAVTLGTAAIFWRRLRRPHSTGATILAWGFTAWGLHHLDYPILRAQGQGLLYGVFADVVCIVAVAVGTLALVLGEQRVVLERRAEQLEQLTQLLLRAQEEERRRISRELHDVAGQALTAAKIGLDLEGRHEASRLVAQALEQVRDLSELLRPRVLEDLGLSEALRTLAEDLSRHARIDIVCELPENLHCRPDLAIALYRVAQESLTNVLRHAGAARVRLRLGAEADLVRLSIEDDGEGLETEPDAHLGLLGMQERISAVGGRLAFDRSALGGLRVMATAPLATGAAS